MWQHPTQPERKHKGQCSLLESSYHTDTLFCSIQHTKVIFLWNFLSCKRVIYMDGLQNNYLHQWIAFYLLFKSLQSTHAFSLLFCVVYKSYNINLPNTFLSSSPKSCILAQFSWIPSWTATVILSIILHSSCFTSLSSVYINPMALLFLS